MRVLVLLSLLGLALSAPLLEENEAEKKPIVKRSEEGIGFGNQQNLPKIKKKSDPAMLADNVGSVLAETPKELTPEDHDEDDAVMQEPDSGNSADSAAKVEEELNAIIKEEQMAQQVAEDEAGETLPGGDEEPETPIEEHSVSTEGSNGGADTEENTVEVVNPEDVAAAVAAAEEPQQELLLQNNGISPENNEAIKELMQENMVNSEPVDDGDNAQEQFAEVVDAPDGPERQDNGAEQSLEMLENPLEAYRMYRNYQNFLSTYPNNYADAYRNYQNGRRRRASSTLMSRLRNREIKRNHRIKRELPYGDSSLFPYFYPEQEQEQEQEDAMYRVLPEQEILGNEPYTLFPEEALEEELAAEEGLPYADEDEEEYGTPVLYDGKMGYFLPSKRQDMLSFVPGNKRESYFFPFSKEPETHYKAFVPEKRSYLESYGDLVRLARALAMEPQDREQYLQGYEWE
uniref:GNQQNxP n=1 Tax=Mizuhopecten yessoensis TaxID=6573 RepID=A0A346GAX3_MIZYE|nr:GNQQNxP [Mizuhopecten yessoensis]